MLKLACAIIGSGFGAWLRPVVAMGADWNKKGFEARSLADVLKSINADPPVASNSIQLKVPEIADDDADVPIFVASKIPNTQMIAIIVESNVYPLAASFVFSNGAEPAVSAHLKVRRTSRITIAVRADGKYFQASKEVKVAAADCAA